MASSLASRCSRVRLANIGARIPEFEPQSLELRAHTRIGDFAPLLVDPGPRPAARSRPAAHSRKDRSVAGAAAYRYRRLTCSSHGNADARRKLRQNIAAHSAYLPRPAAASDVPGHLLASSLRTDTHNHRPQLSCEVVVILSFPITTAADMGACERSQGRRTNFRFNIQRAAAPCGRHTFAISRR